MLALKCEEFKLHLPNNSSVHVMVTAGQPS